MDTEMNKSSTK